MNINFFKFKFFIIIILFSIKEFNIKNISLKKIGVVGLEHSQNVGNNLLKYAIFIIFYSISFIKKHVNLRVINNFSEINGE